MVGSGWIAGLVVVLGTATATATPRVALTAIDGDAGAVVRDAIADALDGADLTVIDQRRTDRVVAQLGKPSQLTDKQLAHLETELDVDAVIVARLAARGAGRSLTVKLYVHGARRGRFTIVFGNPRGKTFVDELRKATFARLDLDVAVRDEDDDLADARPPPQLVSAVPALLPPVAVPAPPPVIVVSPPAPRSRVPPGNAMRFDVGGSVSIRRLEFTVRGNLARDLRPPSYAPGPVLGARATAELYPFAVLDAGSPLRGFGLVAAYDRALSSRVTTNGGPEDATTASVDQEAMSGGVRYRVAIGRATVALGLVLGRQTYRVANDFMNRANLDLPDTDYVLVAPSLDLNVRVGDRVDVVTGVKAAQVLDAGPIAEADAYGATAAHGFAIAAGVELHLGDRLALRIGGEWSQLDLSFIGDGKLAAERDHDPTSRDVGGAVDRSIAGTAALAFRL